MTCSRTNSAAKVCKATRTDDGAGTQDAVQTKQKQLTANRVARCVIRYAHPEAERTGSACHSRLATLTTEARLRGLRQGERIRHRPWECNGRSQQLRKDVPVVIHDFHHRAPLLAHQGLTGSCVADLV